MAVFAAGVRSRGSLLALLLATSVAGLLAVAFLAGPAGAAVAVDHVMITFRKVRAVFFFFFFFFFLLLCVMSDTLCDHPFPPVFPSFFCSS